MPNQKQAVSDSEQAAIDKYDQEQNVLFEKNQQAFLAELNNTSNMEKIFKTGGIEQRAIDHSIFFVKSVDMLKLFLRYSGDVHKPGPPGCPEALYLIHHCILEEEIEKSEILKLIQFLLVEQGVDVNSLTSNRSSPFLLCTDMGYLQTACGEWSRPISCSKRYGKCTSHVCSIWSSGCLSIPCGRSGL